MLDLFFVHFAHGVKCDQKSVLCYSSTNKHIFLNL